MILIYCHDCPPLLEEQVEGRSHLPARNAASHCAGRSLQCN